MKTKNKIKAKQKKKKNGMLQCPIAKKSAPEITILRNHGN